MASCTNCGARVPGGATSCPECGVYAGDVTEEGRPIRRRSWIKLLLGLLVPVLIVAAVSVWMLRPDLVPRDLQRKPKRIHTAPIRVVKDRPGTTRRAPGATINEAEAIRLLRRHLVNTGKVTNDCLAILSNGPRNATYRLTAYNRCDNTRLGRWAVDGKTRAVAPAM